MINRFFISRGLLPKYSSFCCYAAYSMSHTTVTTRRTACLTQLLLRGVQHASHNCCYAAYSKFHLRTMCQTHPPRRSSKKLKTESGGTEHNVNDPAVGSASVECLYNPRRNPPSGYQITSLWDYAFSIERPSPTSIFASRCHPPRVHYQVDRLTGKTFFLYHWIRSLISRGPRDCSP